MGSRGGGGGFNYEYTTILAETKRKEFHEEEYWQYLILPKENGIFDARLEEAGCANQLDTAICGFGLISEERWTREPAAHELALEIWERFYREIPERNRDN
jgi:hypothetical protein